MKLQARMTLPLLLIALVSAIFVVLGAGFLVRYTFSGIFQSQGANIGNIAMTVLESRTDRLEQAAQRLLQSPGSFSKNALALQPEYQLVFAMQVADNRATTAYGKKPGPDCMAKLTDDDSHRPLIISSGNDLLIAGTARDDRTGTVVVIGQSIDPKFVSALKELLLMDIRISSGETAVASSESFSAHKGEFVPSSISIPGPCGETVITMMVPAQTALDTLHKAIVWLIVIAVITLLLILAVHNSLMRQVTRPILALSEAVGKISSGDLATQIPQGGPDELGILVKRFNEMANSLKTAQERLVHSAKLASVGEMVAGISHELNNPLSGLIGQAEYLATKLEPGGTGSEELEIILAEARRMKHTLAQLRGLIKPAEAELVIVAINSLIQDVFLLLRHDTAKSGITCDLSHSIPNLTVRGIPDQLRQVLLNLAINSIQAMPRGGTIRIETDLIMREGKKMVTIRFCDTGSGIKPELIERVFEPFHSGKPGNLGLGLAICREIITRHGGTIGAEAGLANGTAFIIQLPAGTMA